MQLFAQEISKLHLSFFISLPARDKGLHKEKNVELNIYQNKKLPLVILPNKTLPQHTI